MYACPDCTRLVDERVPLCPDCGRDLQALAALHELPDVAFNRAVRAVQQNDWATAALQAGAAVAGRFNDPQAWMLWGLISARQGALSTARTCFQTVLLLSRGYPPAERALQTVEQLQAHGA